MFLGARNGNFAIRLGGDSYFEFKALTNHVDKWVTLALSVTASG